MTEKVWYTAHEVAVLLHVSRRQARRLLRPYRSRCHLARKGSHHRYVLWVPVDVVGEIIAERTTIWKPCQEASSPDTYPGHIPRT